MNETNNHNNKVIPISDKVVLPEKPKERPLLQLPEPDAIQTEKVVQHMAWEIYLRHGNLNGAEAVERAIQFIALQDRRTKRLIEMENAKITAANKELENDQKGE